MKHHAAIQVKVTFQPFLHRITSSTRSWSQNTGVVFATNLRKFTVVVGKENGVAVDDRPFPCRGEGGGGEGRLIADESRAEERLNFPNEGEGGRFVVPDGEGLSRLVGGGVVSITGPAEAGSGW